MITIEQEKTEARAWIARQPEYKYGSPGLREEDVIIRLWRECRRGTQALLERLEFLESSPAPVGIKGGIQARLEPGDKLIVIYPQRLTQGQRAEIAAAYAEGMAGNAPIIILEGDPRLFIVANSDALSVKAGAGAVADIEMEPK